MTASKKGNLSVSTSQHDADVPRDGRAELSFWGLWFRWSSLGPRDKADLIGMLVFAFAGGLVQGLTQADGVGWYRLIAPGMIILSLLLLFRFCRRQDELFQEIILHGAAGVGYGALAAVFSLQFFDHVTGSKSVDAALPVILSGMLIGSVIGTVRAYRKLI